MSWRFSRKLSWQQTSTLHFDLARALVQDGARRDAETIRHLDTADRIRNDPIARDLVRALYRRARFRVWELARELTGRDHIARYPF